MPVLENILFELNGNVLTLTGTDLALSLTVNMDVQGGEDGKIGIPAKRVMDTVRSLPDTDATFSIDTASSKVRIQTGTGEYVLTGDPAKEFPQVPSFKGTSTVTLDNSSLKRIIHRTAFAVSSDELRPAMMGVLLQSKEGSLRAVATDGHRLVRLIHKAATEAALAKDIVIPAKALLVIGKSMEQGESVITVSDTHIRFAFDSSNLVSRLIDESYPNYESVIPQENDKVMVVAREDLIGSVRRVALYASATTHQIRFDISKDSLEVSAQDIDFGGEAKETMKCEYRGADFEIGFNATYLIDMLTHLESNEVQFKFSTATRAGIITPVPISGDEDVMMLVMPVRLNA
jgi:DNA polymerase-3 subunit beta